jgi:alpha-galactosidase
LGQYVNPVRLRLEWLNNERNHEKYPNDPLAPGHYHSDTLFAIVMFASPLGWFETSNLSEEFVGRVAPLISVWNEHRQAIHTGTVVPIGATPDGFAWTGFVAISEAAVYVLVFRELHPSASWEFDLSGIPEVAPERKILGGEGKACIRNGNLSVEGIEQLRFLFARFDRVG